MGTYTKTFFLSSEEDTTKLAEKFSTILKIGDVLLLSGPIGAGKSFFSRALIRKRTDYHGDIPSPTFTLVQTYPHAAGDIWHCDLYRLTDPDEAIELGLDDAFDEAICLIEWPDRLGSLAPNDAINLTFSSDEHGHQLDIQAPEGWEDRLAVLNG